MDKEVTEEMKNQIEELQKQVNDLYNEKVQLQGELTRIMNMFRLTLGIAIQARPEISQLQAMVNMIYKVENE